jgi:hypothetical protein
MRGQPVRQGGIVRVACSTTDSRHNVTADVVAEIVNQLGCGCWRVRTARPGPPADGCAGTMEFEFQVCSRPHGLPGWPAPVVISRPDGKMTP